MTKATRLSEDYCPSDELLEWANSKFPNVDVVLETEKFLNYFIAAPGQKGLKRDWNRTWKNWIINSATRYGNIVRPARFQQSKDERRSAIVGAALRAIQNGGSGSGNS